MKGRRVAPLLVRGLRSRGPRTVLAVFGVATSMMLVLVLFAAYRSLTGVMGSYLGQEGLDLWVSPKGTDNLVRSSAVLPMAWSAGIEQLGGVQAVSPIVRSFVALSSDVRKARLTLMAIGYDAPHGKGGPPNLKAGRAAERDDEVTLDRAAAFRLGVRPGDDVSVNGRRRRVVGLSGGTNLLATQFVFGPLASAEQSLGATGYASFLIVSLADRARTADVTGRIEALFPGANVFTHEEFLRNNQREVAEGFVPLVALITLIGLGSSALLVGLLTQGLVEDRRSDIAVLFAMGASPASVAIGLLTSVELLVVVGSGLGALLKVLLSLGLDRALPTIELPHRGSDLAVAFALFIVAGALAAAMPMLRLRRIDPMESFRA
jgi:putative ABC transport system permease protein